MGDENRTIFHSFVTEAMFLTKQVRADVQPDISFLVSRVKEPTTQYWMKILRVLIYPNCTRDDVLTLETEYEQILYCYVDADFSVHANMKIHTEYVFSLVKGMIVADSTNQKVNARSSTGSDFIGVDDRIGKILWTQRFLEFQGFKVKVNIIYQDNTSTMKLKKNGKTRSENRTLHYDIQYFMLKI